MDISIDTKAELSKTTRGEFDSISGVISFNSNYNYESKPGLVSTGRHEVEHAWQYYLHARNTGGKLEWGHITFDGTSWGKPTLNTGGISDWKKSIFNTFRELNNKKLKPEAETYKEPIENYVSADIDYDKYWQNYIEIKAREAGGNARKDYENQAKEIREAFPFIPKEML